MAGKVAVVTGASRGIGKQVAIDLGAAGYRVVVAARVDRPDLPGTVKDTAELVEAAGGTAMPIDLDVRDEDAILELSKRVSAEWGGCDLLVNNAAIAAPGPTLTQPMKRWRLAVDVNLNGPLYMMAAFSSLMPEGAGRVVNISSSASVSPGFGRASYTVTKRALESLTECMAFELKDRIAVNCIRIDTLIYSEGSVAALVPGMDVADREDPVIISDAILWLEKQPIDYSGKILTVSELRDMGVVRPKTRIGDRIKF